MQTDDTVTLTPLSISKLLLFLIHTILILPLLQLYTQVISFRLFLRWWNVEELRQRVSYTFDLINSLSVSGLVYCSSLSNQWVK